MAFTVSQITASVMGKHRIGVYDVTPDATTGTVDFTTFGHRRIDWSEVFIKSMASFVNSGSTRNIGVWADNVGATGTSIVGTWALTGCVANNTYRVKIHSPS